MYISIKYCCKMRVFYNRKASKPEILVPIINRRMSAHIFRQFVFAHLHVFYNTKASKSDKLVPIIHRRRLAHIFRKLFFLSVMFFLMVFLDPLIGLKKQGKMTKWQSSKPSRLGQSILAAMFLGFLWVVGFRKKTGGDRHDVPRPRR